MSAFSRRKLLLAAGTALAAGAAGGVFGFRALHRRPKHVILVVVDALRADRLGCYGGPRETLQGRISLTPGFDDIASQGTLFERCIAPSSWTLMSVPAILGSRFPFVEGDSFNMSFMPPRAATLAQALRSSGYSTHAVVANAALSGSVAAGVSVSRGFDTYEVPLPDMIPNPLFAKHIGGEKVYDRCTGASLLFRLATQHLERAHTAGRPAFIYVHPMETHEPYTAIGRFLADCAAPRAHVPDFMLCEAMRDVAVYEKRTVLAEKDLPLLARAAAVYDAAVRTVDMAVSSLADYLDSHDAGAETLLAVTADHGEEFGEHNWFAHAQTLYTESIHVPLVFRGAGVPSGIRCGDLVSSIDIAPTLLHALGLAIPPSMVGVPRPLAENVAADGRGMISSLTKPCTDQAIEEKEYSITDPTGMKLIRREFAGAKAAQGVLSELYDARHDPCENSNLAASRPAAVAALEKRLQFVRNANVSGPGQKIVLDEKAREQLKALGYIGH